MIPAPIFPENNPALGFLGGDFIISCSTGSMPSANAGRLSVTKFTNSICAGNKNVCPGKAKREINIPNTSTQFVEIKN